MKMKCLCIMLPACALLFGCDSSTTRTETTTGTDRRVTISNKVEVTPPVVPSVTVTNTATNSVNVNVNAPK